MTRWAVGPVVVTRWVAGGPATVMAAAGMEAKRQAGRHVVVAKVHLEARADVAATRACKEIDDGAE